MKKVLIILNIVIIMILVGCSKETNTDDKKGEIEIDCNLFPKHLVCRDKIKKSEPEEVMEYNNAPVFLGDIEGEKPKPKLPLCYPGAWYRKVISSKDQWYGIEGTIRLGDFIGDPVRHEDRTKDDGTYLNRYLDNASVYMGGNAGKESDVGLTWNVGCKDKACFEKPNGLSTERFTYRPFWRWIGEDEDGKYGNHYRNSKYLQLEYYYFPGDLVQMSVINTKPGYLRLRIELLEKTTIKKYADIRESFELPEDASKVFLSPEFKSVGFGEEGFLAEFKRVNAIDQVNNEGHPVQDTNAQVSKATWESVYLYRRIDGKLYKVPFNDSRAAYMACSNKDAFIIDRDNLDSSLGGENITINPSLLD